MTVKGVANPPITNLGEDMVRHILLGVAIVLICAFVGVTITMLSGNYVFAGGAAVISGIGTFLVSKRYEQLQNQERSQAK